MSTTDTTTPRPTVPDPREVPVIPLWPDTGQILGLGRAATYASAKRGEIPTLPLSGKLRVPTAALRRMLGLDLEDDPR